MTTPPIADLGDGDVLLRMLVGGICGSDLPHFRACPISEDDLGHEHFGVPGFPMHEIVGEVVASRDPSIAVGERVVGWAIPTNGLAEYVVTPGQGLYRFDPGLSPTVALMLQSLACVLYAMENIPDIAGHDVAVIGLGPIGLLFCHAAKTAGARRVIGVDVLSRADVAGRFCIDDVVVASSGEWASGLDNSSRPHVVVEAVGHQAATLAHAVEAVAPGGVVYCFGAPDTAFYPFPINTFLRKNLRLAAGITLDRRRVLSDAEAYIRKFPEIQDNYVSHSFSARDANAAYQAANTPAVGQFKIALTME